MKKAIIFILLNLFCLVIAQDILTLKNGQTYEGTLVKMNDTNIYFKEKEMKSLQVMPLKLVKSVHNKNGEILFSGDDISLADMLKQEAKKNKTIIVRHSSLKLGAILIAGSGVLGIYNTTRKCDDCVNFELRKFANNTESILFIQYLMLFFGGICILGDEVIIEQ